MKALVATATMFLLFQLTLVGFSIGEGFLVHWLLPAVELSTAILSGLAATIAVACFIAYALESIAVKRIEDQGAAQNEGAADDEAEDDAEIDDFDENVEHHAREINRLLNQPLPPMQHRRRQSRRRKK